MKKSSTKNTAKKVNKPEEGLTVSQSQQLDNTFERASTLDEKRLAAVQMIQSGLLPTPWQQLISWMIQKHEKAIGGVILLSNTVER
jgi:anti-sigma28 factor (negative regulator of flagellin synthesis)